MVKCAMPYKNIEDKRAYFKRWKARNKDKVRRGKLIEYITRKKHPFRMTCSINGCNELGERHHVDYDLPEEIIWLCKTHHEAEHHKIVRLCKIENCGLKHFSKGFCNRHFLRWRRGALEPHVYVELAA